MKKTSVFFILFNILFIKYSFSQSYTIEDNSSVLKVQVSKLFDDSLIISSEFINKSRSKIWILSNKRLLFNPNNKYNQIVINFGFNEDNIVDIPVKIVSILPDSIFKVSTVIHKNMIALKTVLSMNYLLNIDFKTMKSNFFCSEYEISLNDYFRLMRSITIEVSNGNVSD